MPVVAFTMSSTVTLVDSIRMLHDVQLIEVAESALTEPFVPESTTLIHLMELLAVGRARGRRSQGQVWAMPRAIATAYARTDRALLALVRRRHGFPPTSGAQVESATKGLVAAGDCLRRSTRL